MKTDRELLDLAAKAAGLNVVDTASPGLRISSDGCCAGYYWNPLADDGDALRLAVALQLTIANEHVTAGAAYCIRGDEAFPDVFCAETGSDKVLPSDYDATRRAIVLAAADIGEEMP